MAVFSEALRDSKLFTLPMKSVARRIKSANTPRHQVLDTTSASAHRRNWGLKFPVAGPNSKKVSFSEFEDDMSTNGVNVSPRFQKNVANLEEVGAPITLRANGRFNSLFDAPTVGKNKKGLQYMTKSEFQRKLQQARDFKPTDSRSAEHFLAEIGVSSSVEQLTGAGEPVQWQNSSIGATYATPGVLFNTPHGIKAYRTAKGHVLQRRSTNVAFGGFLTSQVLKIKKEPFAKEQELFVNKIYSSLSGELEVSTNKVESELSYEHGFKNDFVSKEADALFSKRK